MGAVGSAGTTGVRSTASNISGSAVILSIGATTGVATAAALAAASASACASASLAIFAF
jgi:hypothetical protein